MTVSGPFSHPAGDQRLTDDEIDRLLRTHDIISLGMMADEARRRRHGLMTTFVRVVDVTVDAARQAADVAAGEVRLLGSPATRAEATKRVHAAVEWAGGAPVSGFSLADLEQLAAVEHVTLRSLLEELHATGLELVAEAPIDRLRDPRRSIEEVNIAGLGLARLTLQQGVPMAGGALFKKVAELQRAVGVIRAFAPLPRTLNPALPTTGFEDVMSVALARLVVDNVRSIKVDWALYGPKLAQVALTVGADDIDGVSAEFDTSVGVRRGPLEEIRRSIRACGQEPLERNGRFEPITR